jgi:Nucleotidyl transferase AbiEii toxin, Type IV TA system
MSYEPQVVEPIQAVLEYMVWGKTMNLKCLSPATRKVLKLIAPVISKYGFVLAGGTAASLHLGHRKSIDFDLFARQTFQPGELLRDIGRLGLMLSVLQEESGTLTISANGVKISFFYHPYDFIEPTKILSGVIVAGLVDIAAMKTIAMMQRGAKRDYVDLYYILQDIPFSKVANNLVERYGSSRINPLVAGKALVYFQDADSDPDPEYLEEGVAWSKVKRYFMTHVQQFVLDIQAVIKNSAD